MKRTTAFLLATLLWLTLANRPAAACPFCPSVSQTLGEEMDAKDVVVLARLTFSPPAPKVGEAGADVELVRSKFTVIETLKGAKLIDAKKPIEVLYFGEGKVGHTFLLMGADPPKINWTTPTLLTDSAAKYIKQIPSLPKSGAERLKFFMGHLESQDEMLARDAYDEFARAPYDAVRDLSPQMDHAQLIAWIRNPDIPASRRRLYLTMLGTCGDKRDLPMLAEMLRSDDRKVKGGLDAMIACYLTLAGPEGMPLIEDLFLKNKEAEYADTYSAIMALRFHGTESDIVPRKRIVEGMRHMLDRSDLADLVIVDLARWEDWEVMPRLVKLFKEADDKSSWVRVPVVRFLMQCPEPAAKKHLQELEAIDPGAIKRAQTFFPFGGGDPSKSEEKGEEKEATLPKTSAATAPRAPVATLPARRSPVVTPPTNSTETAIEPAPAANLSWKFGVPILVGVVLGGLWIGVRSQAG